MCYHYIVLLGLSYSTVGTVYGDHEGLGFLAPKYYPKTSLIFVTSKQDWLGIVKLKKCPKSFHEVDMKFNFFHLVLTDLLTNAFRQALLNDGYSYRLDFFLHCSTLLCPKMCLFANRNVCIIVLPFLSPLPHRWWFAVCVLWLQCKTWVSAMLTEALLMLFFAWNVTKSVRNSEKQSAVIQRSDLAIHPLKPISGVA